MGYYYSSKKTRYLQMAAPMRKGPYLFLKLTLSLSPILILTLTLNLTLP